MRTKISPKVAPLAFKPYELTIKIESPEEEANLLMLSNSATCTGGFLESQQRYCGQEERKLADEYLFVSIASSIYQALLERQREERRGRFQGGSNA